MLKKRVLYLGLDPSHYFLEAHEELQHHPLIKTVPLSLEGPAIKKILDFSLYTHCIFTSKTAVELLFEWIPLENWENKVILAVGKRTGAELAKKGMQNILVAEEETAEGMVSLLSRISLKDAFTFWPHSSGARRVIPDYFQENHFLLVECEIYQTISHLPSQPIDLKKIDTIVFTSPSTVKAFREFYGELPDHVNIRNIGPITLQALRKEFKGKN